MDKNLNKSAYSLFARSEYDNAQEVQNLRCAFLCALSTRTRTIFLTLVLALTVLATTGMVGVNVYAETGTVRVATFDQLRVALEDTQGVKKIVVDPQAAADDGDVIYSVENDENSDAFYIGFDGPLTVSHDITITSADGVDVYFARSDSFRRDQGNPALFNIDRTGNLKLEGLITMTGEEVTTAYNDREFVFSIKSRDGTGDDNDAWNRGQVLKGGFYIQNNGGEYNLGDDVILEDFHTTDDVEGVEPIHEKETNSLFGGGKADEEATTEEATEEKEEETVVAPAPKRMMMKSASPQLRGAAIDTVYVGGYWVDHQSELPSNARAVNTWTEAVNILGTNPGTIYIGKTNNVSGVISTKNPSQQVVKRAGSYEIRQRPTGNKDFVLEHDGKFYISTNKGANAAKDWEPIDDWNSDWQYHWDNNYTKLDDSALKGTTGLPETINHVFRGVMFNVPQNQTATFKNIHVDGDNLSATETCIEVKGNATLNILSGAKFEYLRNMGSGKGGSDSSSGFGGVIRAGYRDGTRANGAKIFIDGGIFENNEAKYEGGVIYASGIVTITVRSGQFRKNKAHAASVIANYDEDAGNLIELYNAVIRNNKTDEAGKTSTYTVIGPYSDDQNNYNPNYILKNVQGDKPYGGKMTAYYGKTDGSAGGINICIAGNAQAELYGVDGAAIYGNTGDKGDIGVWTYQQNLNPDYARHYPNYYTNVSPITTTNINDHFSYTYGANMLGGGSHRWSEGVITYRGQNISGVKYNPNGYRSNPSESDKASAMNAHTTIIEDNLSHYHGAIQTNRKLVFGRSKAAFELKKIDGVTGDSIGGVEFKLYSGNNTSGTPVKTATTNALGLLIMNGLDAGEYTLVETKKEGYQAPGITWKVTVTGTNVSIKPSNSNQNLNEDDAGYYVIENTPESQVISISLTKVKQNGTSLGEAITENAKFAIYEADKTPGQVSSNGTSFNNNVTISRKSGGITQTNLTTSNGVLTINELEREKLYLLFETSAPAGYAKSKAPWLVYVKADGTYRLFKHNSTNPEDTSWSTGVGGNNFSEIAGNNAGKLGNAPLDFSFTKGDRTDSSVNINEAKFVLYHATKTEGTPNVYTINTGMGANGKLDGEVTAINGKYVLPITAPSNGTAYYMMFETTAREGYVLPKAPWGIAVNPYGDIRIYRMADSDAATFEANYVEEFGDLSITQLNKTQLQKISIDCDTINVDTERKLVNEKTPIQITKVAGTINNNQVTLIERDGAKIPLAGAKFQLYKAKNVIISETDKHWHKGDAIGGVLTSDENGIITLPQEVMKLNGANDVDYWLEEISPAPGYQLSTRPWIVNVDQTTRALKNIFWPKNDPVTDNGVTKIRSGDPNVQFMNSSYVFNELKPIELYKVDETDDANRLGGAQFVICEAEVDQNNNYWIKNAKNGNTWNDSATVMSTAKKENGQTKVYTSSNDDATKGKIVIDDLEGSTTGKYYLLFEKTAPIGFVRSTSPWVIKVVDNETGRTVVVKKIADASNQGKVLVPGGNDAVNWEIVSDSTSAENQTVKERWWADAWYQTYNSETYNLANEPKYLTKVDLSEVGDEDEAHGLSGAEFELFKAHRGHGQDTDDYFYRKEEDHPIDTYTTGADGKINLPSSVTTDDGWYLLFETAAPNGYKRTYTPWLLTVSNGNITVQRFNGEKLKISYVNTVYGYQTISEKTWWQHSHFLEETWNDKYRVPNVPNDVTLTKVDGYNASKKLKGAQFEIFSYERTSENDYRVKESKGLTSVSDDDGRFTLPVTDGKYIMFEKQAPKGYALSDKPWWIEIIRSTDRYGITSVRVRVVPAQDSTPSGTWPDGEWATTWRTFCADQTYDTVKNYPSINLTKLDLESVTKAYDSSGKETVSLKTDNPTIYLEGVKFKLFNATVSSNNPKTATWTKTDENSPVMVTGAEADGTIKTNKDGVLELGTLADGNYILEETEAKDGYIKPDRPWRLVVTNGKAKVYVPADDGKYVETAHNQYLTNVKHYTLPKSGGMGTYWFMIIGMGMMTFAVTTLLTRKFAKKKL